MAIYGSGGRMGAYASPAQGAGTAVGGILGALGKKFKDSLFDDKGLVRANPDGPGMPILGKQKGFDESTKKAYENFRGKLYDDEGLVQRTEDGGLRLGAYEGLDALEEKDHAGEFKGIDMLRDNKGFVQGGKFVNPYKGRFAKESPLSGLGSRLRTMLGRGEVEAEGPVQPTDMSLSGAVGRTEEDIRNAPNQDVLVNQETGENYGNVEVTAPLLASKVSDPSQVPPKHAGMMQKFLNTQGFQLEEDGKWGPKSTKAMAEWMQRKGVGNPLSKHYDEFIGPNMPRNAVYKIPAAQVSTSREQG